MFNQVSGIILVNKPVGFSSQYVVTGVKHAFSAKKAGHTGTLDQMASGMLPVCLGEATKFASFLTDARKSYTAKLLFGYKSSTGDMEGICLEKVYRQFSIEQLSEVLADFVGEVAQVPPMFSALKYNGVPLYRMARQGQQVKREPRKVNIYKLEIVDFTWPWLTLNIACSKGTYIRTLAEDIAKNLSSQAYLVALHRTGVMGFDDCQTHDFWQIKSGDLRGLMATDKMVSQLSKVFLCAAEALGFCNGQVINKPGLTGMVAVYGSNLEFLGVGEIVNGGLRPRRLMRTN